MNENELRDFFNYLKKNHEIFGPAVVKDELNNQSVVLIKPLESFDELVLDERLPFFSFKKFFVPENEKLFGYNDVDLTPPQSSPSEGEGINGVALFGINLLDLKSVLLYDQVFEKDPYYQEKRQNILVIGHGIAPNGEQNIFNEKFEEDVLEHLSFDIFIADDNKQTTPRQNKFGAGQADNGQRECAVFTGSIKGQKILAEFGYKDFNNIQFSGPVKEGKLDERMMKLQDKLKNKHNQKIWDELGKRCIECGKCTIACPTCFCFRIDDQAELGPNRAQRGDRIDTYGGRQRCWDSCFYQEFSEVAGPPRVDERQRVEAGGHKFLNSTAARIHFWYYHKFARIPDEFNFVGCVGCHRCAAVCPVGIDIVKVLGDIENS